MSTASQGAFAVIPEISLADISCIKNCAGQEKQAQRIYFLLHVLLCRQYRGLISPASQQK